MPLADNQNMIQALAPKRPNQAFSVGVLPGRPRRYGSVANPHRSNSTLESLPVGAIIVPHQIGRCCIPRERLYDLLRQPLRGRIAGYRKPQKLPPFLTQNKKGKEALEGQSWNHAEINRCNGIRMVMSAGWPWLGSLFSRSSLDGRRHDFLDRPLPSGVRKVKDDAVRIGIFYFVNVFGFVSIRPMRCLPPAFSTRLAASSRSSTHIPK
jgi:hypothetical protein